jgi:hypothetical protein
VASVRIRRIARRSTPEGSSGPRDFTDFVSRRLQLRLIAFGGFFALLFLFGLYLKLEARFGATPVIAGAVLIVAGAIAAWRLSKRGVTTDAEAKDDEADFPASEVDRQLLAGELSPRDLVRENGAWASLLDSQQFSDAAGTRQSALDRRSRLAMGAMVLLGSGALFGAVALFYWVITPDKY